MTAGIAFAGPSAVVAEAAEEAAGAGGSLIDVLVAGALTAMCTEPGVCAPGGGGFIVIDPPDAPAVAIDGYMSVPGIGFQGEARALVVEMAYGGGVRTEVGAGSVAVPGSLPALQEAWKRFGTLAWSDLMGIVAELVEGGFPLSRTARTYLEEAGRLIFWADASSRRALFDGDRLKEEGELVEFEGLSDSLRLIGDEGASALHGGELGRRVVADLQRRGSALTVDDLARYRVAVAPALETSAGPWQIATVPTAGGRALAAALGHMSGGGFAPGSYYPALREVAGSRRSLLLEPAPRSPSTIAVAAADASGTAAAASMSAGYGSGVVPAETGWLMNNGLGELELIPEGASELEPGRRLGSNMAPVVARRGAETVALATPGAERITSALAITLARLAAGDPMSDAIDHPRLHPEPEGAAHAVAAEEGAPTGGLSTRWFSDPHMYFGGVNGAARLEGALSSHADRRRGGEAIVI